MGRLERPSHTPLSLFLFICQPYASFSQSQLALLAMFSLCLGRLASSLNSTRMSGPIFHLCIETSATHASSCDPSEPHIAPLADVVCVSMITTVQCWATAWATAIIVSI